MQHSKLKTLLHETNIERQPPANLVNGDEMLFGHDMKKALPNIYLLEFRNVNVTPESIVWKGFEIAKELLIFPSHTSMYNWKYTVSNRIKRKMEKLPPDDYILCTDYWAEGYFHWVCDSLPRLFLAKDILVNGTLLMPEQYRAPYYRETLEAFKIKNIRTIPLKTYYNVERLITPEQPAPSGEHSPAVTKDLRSYLLNYFGNFFTGKLNFPNVYISRNKAKYRKVLNEEQLVEILNKYDFKVIYYEDYSMKEQIEISYNTKNLVSLHGANLTNVLYMQPGGNVMEFRKKNDTINNYYYSLADEIGCKYYYQNCEYIDRRVGNFFDVTVDLEIFETNLRKMLGIE
jgi:hypothetical protein